MPCPDLRTRRPIACYECSKSVPSALSWTGLAAMPCPTLRTRRPIACYACSKYVPSALSWNRMAAVPCPALRTIRPIACYACSKSVPSALRWNRMAAVPCPALCPEQLIPDYKCSKSAPFTPICSKRAEEQECLVQRCLQNSQSLITIIPLCALHADEKWKSSSALSSAASKTANRS